MPFPRLAAALAGLAVLLAGCVTGDEGSDGVPGDPPGDVAPGANGTVTWGVAASATLRPGASLGGYCTFNFLFNDTLGNAFIGTAGHCTDEVGERVKLGGGDEVGTVVYDSDVAEGADAAVDFSLIMLDADQVATANPLMLGYDAPTGFVTASEVAPGDRVALHGYGVVVGEADQTRDRSGVLLSMDDKLYTADMPAVNGDSGSPLIHLDTGKALGIVSHYGLGGLPPTTDEGPVMEFILAELHKAGFMVGLATV